MVVLNIIFVKSVGGVEKVRVWWWWIELVWKVVFAVVFLRMVEAKPFVERRVSSQLKEGEEREKFDVEKKVGDPVCIYTNLDSELPLPLFSMTEYFVLFDELLLGSRRTPFFFLLCFVFLRHNSLWDLKTLLAI